MSEKREYPSPADVVEGIKNCGTLKAYARSIKVPERSLGGYIDRVDGLREQVDRVREENKKRQSDRAVEVEKDFAENKEAIEQEQQKAENRALKREVGKLRGAIANRDAVVQRIEEAARIPVQVPDLEVPEPRIGDNLPSRSVVLPIYDIQYGQAVIPEDTPFGLGEFNSGPVFDARLERYFQATTASLYDLAAGHKIEELVFALGGDFVEGADIFKGQAWQLDKDPAMQLYELKKRMLDLILSIIKFARESLGVERIGVYVVGGNHGKVGGKQAGATHNTMSWDVLLGMLLVDDLKDHVDQAVVEPGGMLLFETAGHRFLMIHGDELKGWGGIPFYGISRFDGRALRLVGEDAYFHFCLLGHHHQASNTPNGEDGRYIMSGDWCGPNNMSRHLVSGTRPQQRLLLVGQKYGITHDVPIYLTLRSDRPAVPVHSLIN